MRQDSFWKQYFRTLNRHKLLAAATFSLVVGSFGVVAIPSSQPSASYYAEGVLVDNEPLASVSETSAVVHNQGKGIINESLLLSDILLEEASVQLKAEDISLTPTELAEKTTLSVEVAKLPSNQLGADTEEPNSTGGRVFIQVVGGDPASTETTLAMMMKAMVKLSEATNTARLAAISEELTTKIAGLKSSIQAETTALQSIADSDERALAEKQIEVKKTALEKAIASLADAEIAESEIVSSLTVAQPPTVSTNESDEPSPLSIMASGISTAVLVVGWLMFGLNSIDKNKPKKGEPE